MGTGGGVVAVRILDKELLSIGLFSVGSCGRGTDCEATSRRTALGMTLAEKVYWELRRVPKGRVTTYKWLARAVGTKGYQAVGQILKRNPDAPKTPCHRVVNANGKIGGFMGKRDGSEIEKKIVLLREEGIEIKGGKIDLRRYGFDFSS